MKREAQLIFGTFVALTACVGGSLTHLRVMRMTGGTLPGLFEAYQISPIELTRVVFGDWLNFTIELTASAALIAGCILIAWSRGRSWKWGLFGLLSFIGILILLLMPEPAHRKCANGDGIHGPDSNP